MLELLQLLAILSTAVAMAGGWAHLLELRNKMALSREDYLTVQQIYRGWALLGLAVVGALVSTAALAFLQRGEGAPFVLALTAALCIAVTLVVFFAITLPANRATENWTELPERWESLRWRWEYSHAVNALLYFVALFCLALALVTARP